VEGEYGFSLGAYDTGKVLVVDPLLDYSTLIGGNGDDRASDLYIDSNGNPYLTGLSTSISTLYPTTNGSYDRTHNGMQEAFVTKLSKNGSSLLYSTYLGGSNDDIGVEIVVDPSGNAYIMGRTEDGSPDFPTTSGAYDTTQNGNRDAFITKINQSGSGLLFSTFLGGSSDEYAWGICIDDSRNVYVTGATDGGTTPFPTTTNAYDTTHHGNRDVFVSKLSADGSSLVYSTFVGGNQPDTGHDIVIDDDNCVYVAGTTDSSDFPTTPGAYSTSKVGNYDVLLFKLNQTGQKLIFSTFIGGSANDYARGICLDSSGNSYISGYCNSGSTPYPTTKGAFDTTHNGNYDVFVTKVNSTGQSINFSPTEIC
jgi:hypothetical protein